MNALRGRRIAIIGAGKMGQALIKGLLARGLSRRAVVAAESNAATRQAIRRRFRIAVTDDNVSAVRHADVVMLAVKPQQFREVIGELAPHLRGKQLVISIAAGITLRWLEQRLPRVPLIRVMPNLPATVGCGFAAVATGRRATARHRAIALAIFGAVGEVAELPERSFDAMTAVSGSGPAYVLFLVQAWQEAARTLGLSDAVAHRAIQATLRGSVTLLEESRESAASLIAKVASKGGTTEAALKQLARRRVAAHFAEALQAAAKRSKELAWS